jgi:hypothetical protein
LLELRLRIGLLRAQQRSFFDHQLLIVAVILLNSAQNRFGCTVSDGNGGCKLRVEVVP